MSNTPLAAMARHAFRNGDMAEAERCVAQLTAEITGHEPVSVRIRRDAYSLNSLNGFAEFITHAPLFFKYHHEDGEDETVSEYYNAGLLKEAGYRVDVPLYMCGEPGRQILFYAMRETPRLADVCREYELLPQPQAELVAAQQRADDDNLLCYQATLNDCDDEAMAAEPVHQLFYHRLMSEGCAAGLGGRVREFYVDQSFRLAETELSWEQLSSLAWEVNGRVYRTPLLTQFQRAAELLAPAALTDQGVVTAHGDAHNANVWLDADELDQPVLTFFDPAFAGRQIPALLAEVKATFHNIFAHPFWLYEPDQAAQYFQAQVQLRSNRIVVRHNWQLSPLRKAFLRSKAERFWGPWLKSLKQAGRLPADWQDIIRLALFCCPTLVMSLRAGASGGHNPVSSAIAWSVAVMMSQAPEQGQDALSEVLSDLAESLVRPD